MKVTVGNKPVSLTDRDFLTQGGEGAVYLQGGIIYKIWLDPATKALPPKKLSELAALNRANIVRPVDVIEDGFYKQVGLTYREVPHAVSLSNVCSLGYQQKNALDIPNLLKLLVGMEETTDFIHGKGCLIVDGNEFNYLLSGGAVHFIDVDSYQTPSFPATAIMAGGASNIRDYHATAFSELSDWFSFGVVACQLLLGIHPYKGSHPKYGKNLVERMKANVSIFNVDVRVPSTARSPSALPAPYREWFEDMFERGKRAHPPHAADMLRVTVALPIPAQVSVTSPSVRQTAGLDIQVLLTHEEPIYHHCWRNGKHLFNEDAHAEWVTDAGTRFDYVRGRLSLLRTLPNGRTVTDNARSWVVLPNATSRFDGLLVSDVLGLPYFYVPEAESCHIFSVPDLVGWRVLDAKREREYVGVRIVNMRTSAYAVRLYQANLRTNTLRMRRHFDTDAELNFTVLTTGVGLCIVEDGTLVMFDALREVELENAAIRRTMRLTNMGHQAAFSEGSALYSLRMSA